MCWDLGPSLRDLTLYRHIPSAKALGYIRDTPALRADQVCDADLRVWR